MVDSWGINCEIALRWMFLDLTDDKLTLAKIMAWFHQATRHYMNQCWLRYLMPYGVTRPQWVKTDKLLCFLILNVLNHCKKIQNTFPFFYHSSAQVPEVFHMADKELFILHLQYHCCWWPGNTGSQEICCHSIQAWISTNSIMFILNIVL